jgi:hypothetical protein
MQPGLDDDLPFVAHAMPTLLRIVLIAAGLFAIVIPMHELGGGLWPPSFLTLFFGVIVCGGATVGLAFVAAGVYGETQRWRYEPHGLVVERHGWRSVSHTRLAASDIVSIVVRRVENSEGPDSWRVAVAPRIPIEMPRAARWFSSGAVMFETGDYRTPERAEKAKVALMKHLGMRPA